MNVIKEINRLNEIELSKQVIETASWHAEYKDSAYIFAGGLSYDLTEGDIICIFSQFGEIVDVDLLRDQKTGKSKGSAFIAYEDQRSTILAVDNFNGTQILGRTIRVDHVKNYKGKNLDKMTAEELEEEKQRRQFILPPHLRENAEKEEEEEPEEELPSDIALMDPEDPMKEYMIKKWRKKQKKKQKKLESSSKKKR